MAVTAPPKPAVRLPSGLKWSDVWETDDGLVRGTRELPVDATTLRIRGQLYLCQVAECQTEEWVFAPLERPRFCPDDGAALVSAGIDPNDPNAVDSARHGLTVKVRQAVIAKRDRAVDEAKAKANALRQQVETAAARTAADMKGHVPSMVATVAGLGGAAALRVAEGAMLTGAVGVTTAAAGTVAAYLVAYPLLNSRASKRRDPADPVDEFANRKARRRIRGQARQIAAGVFALGAWTITIAAVGVDPSTIGGGAAILVGCAGGWAVNRRHWETLWSTRRRLRELARQKALEAAQLAQEEADRLERGEPAPSLIPAVVVVEDVDSPLAAGKREAATWARIANSGDVPSGFQMRRTRIIPEETREVTIPDAEGNPIRIGFEFSGVCEPGALVARPGMQPPLHAAAAWLASMHERDTSTMSVVDRPTDDDGDPRPNRFLVLLTDRAPLGAGVPWKGRAGVRTGADGTVYVHGGRTLTGDNVEEIIYSPGRPMGGLTVGHTGSGKTAGTILRLLNCLAAGVFPLLDDPKNLVDYADFCGVFPIGVTAEHARIIVNSLDAERKRRERNLSPPIIDRHGRSRPGEGVWNLNEGPPIYAVFEEFHLRAMDPAFAVPLTSHVRLQRAAAMGVEAITQAGGLADLKDSVLRGLLQLTGLRLYRTTDASAALAGYRGNYQVSSLPRVPGVCLVVSEEAPPLPLRAAYVTRAVDDDSSVYDQLWAPDMTPLLAAPKLPAATVEVFRREGLMDLWELGQGPNGRANLLSDDTTNYAPTGPAGEETVVGRMQAGDVLLAIALTTPGCNRAAVSTHPVWATAPGWGKPPTVPSTLSRAVVKLTKEGLVAYTDTTGYRVTPKGEQRASAAAAVLFGRATPTVDEEEHDVAPADTADLTAQASPKSTSPPVVSPWPAAPAAPTSPSTTTTATPSQAGSTRTTAHA